MSKLFQTSVSILLLLSIHPAWSSWDFAVTTKSKVIFYNDHWQRIATTTHEFSSLWAIAFDETNEIIYFSDNSNTNGSIFSLKISVGRPGPEIVEKVVTGTDGERVTSMAFDPLHRNLYWSEANKQKIFYLPVDAANTVEPKVFLDFSEEQDTYLDGIALDICRRQIYWTNSSSKKATIERASLDDGGINRQVIIDTNMHFPHGIVVDQMSDRIFYVVDQDGIHYTVESANLDGTDRVILLKDTYQKPYSIAVTKTEVIWTDLSYGSIYRLPKHLNNETNILDEKNYNAHNIVELSDARGIVTRLSFLTRWQEDKNCSNIVNQIKSRLLSPNTTNTTSVEPKPQANKMFCLNGGEFIEQTNQCFCKLGYKGAYCETSECYNYCVHGTCSMSNAGFPHCTCQEGVFGERCQATKCAGYCVNGGLCKLLPNGEPWCDCKPNFGGDRCEENSTEICSLFCRILKLDPSTYVPFGCHEICKNLTATTENGNSLYALPSYKHLDVCRSTSFWTSTVLIVLVTGVVASCGIVLLIIHGVRRFYKPLRPRIKKTFVVRKQTTSSTDTPLTNRPIATEQCEITIENCCNMNICDTPCFDPKLVQQTLSCDGNTKEDKKMLIHNMEDDLY